MLTSSVDECRWVNDCIAFSAVLLSLAFGTGGTVVSKGSASFQRHTLTNPFQGTTKRNRSRVSGLSVISKMPGKCFWFGEFFSVGDLEGGSDVTSLIIEEAATG